MAITSKLSLKSTQKEIENLDFQHQKVDFITAVSSITRL